MKKNLSIISDMKRVFWTVWFRMVFLVFLFFSDSSPQMFPVWKGIDWYEGSLLLLLRI